MTTTMDTVMLMSTRTHMNTSMVRIAATTTKQKHLAATLQQEDFQA
ncbi:hypothetical protein MCHI_001291 [Candidatus Magnetoovum chiemensis]|nr:hypothetical protein MCHI_001291 [Candidatus Magnetoovum chiemensis]